MAAIIIGGKSEPSWAVLTIGQERGVCVHVCALGRMTCFGGKGARGGSRQDLFRLNLRSSSCSVTGSTVWAGVGLYGICVRETNPLSTSPGKFNSWVGSRDSVKNLSRSSNLFFFSFKDS